MNRQLEYLQLWLFIGLLLVAAVIYFSLAPVPEKLQLEFQYADKIEHALTYCMLMLWFGQLTLMRARIVSALLLVFLGTALEFLQGMTAYRQFDIFDMAANTAGVLTGLYLSSSAIGESLNNSSDKHYGNCFLRIEQLIKSNQNNRI